MIQEDFKNLRKDYDYTIEQLEYAKTQSKYIQQITNLKQ